MIWIRSMLFRKVFLVAGVVLIKFTLLFTVKADQLFDTYSSCFRLITLTLCRRPRKLIKVIGLLQSHSSAHLLTARTKLDSVEWTQSISLKQNMTKASEKHAMETSSTTVTRALLFCSSWLNRRGLRMSLRRISSISIRMASLCCMSLAIKASYWWT